MVSKDVEVNIPDEEAMSKIIERARTVWENEEFKEKIGKELVESVFAAAKEK